MRLSDPSFWTRSDSPTRVFVLCMRGGPSQVSLSDPVDRTVRPIVVRYALCALVPDLSDPFILEQPDCAVLCAPEHFGVFAGCVDWTVRPSGPDCPTHSAGVLSASLHCFSWRFEGGLLCVFPLCFAKCVASQWPTLS